jgi:hypothetical protein
MNIPLTVIEPFGVIGIPIIKMPMMHRYATRQLEVCMGRIGHWLYMGGSEGLTDVQICGHIIFDLLHDGRDEWLDVRVRSDYAKGGSISLHLQHLKQDIRRHTIFTHTRTIG